MEVKTLAILRITESDLGKKYQIFPHFLTTSTSSSDVYIDHYFSFWLIQTIPNWNTKFDGRRVVRSQYYRNLCKIQGPCSSRGICSPERCVENAFWRTFLWDALQRVLHSSLNTENHASQTCTVWWQCEKYSNKPNSPSIINVNHLNMNGPNQNLVSE